MTELTTITNTRPAAALDNLIAAWADSKTDKNSHRSVQIVSDKKRYLGRFFEHAGKPPQQCGPSDVSEWIETLRGRNLSEATIYSMTSAISSFYEWVKRNTGDDTMQNPVKPVRPKAPKPYQGEKTKALTDDQLRALTRHLRTLAHKPDARLQDVRDYALLLAFMASGMRLNEIMSLKRKSVRPASETGILIETRVKGGEIVQKEIAQPAVENAMLDYVARTGRKWNEMAPDEPIWLAHDREGRVGAISNISYYKSMRKHARAAGIEGYHPHMTRHTHARILAEETGSLGAVQDALGHSNQQTTHVYVKRLGIRRDRHSDLVMDRMG